MGGFEDALRRAVVEDRAAFADLRSDLDERDACRARLRAENEAAIRDFIAAKATATDPGLSRWRVRTCAGIRGWKGRGTMSGWPVEVRDEVGNEVTYFVRDDGEVFSTFGLDGVGTGRPTVLNPEPADLGIRPLAGALQAE